MPRLYDPEEFAIIRKIYFKNRLDIEEIDPIEKLDRSHSRNRKINKR